MKKIKITSVFMFIMAIGLIISQSFGIWYFIKNSISLSTSIGIRSDILNYNTEDTDLIGTDEPKKYDVYFMAQNINIQDFIRYSNAINNTEFKPGIGFKDLFYTKPTQGISAFTPKLGSWDSTFTGFAEGDTDEEREQKLFKKFEDRYYLSEEDILAVGEPYSKICDGNTAGTFKLDFVDWTLDVIRVNYPVQYDTDDDYNLPLINENTGEKVVKFSEITGATMYHRESWHGESGGHIRVYGCAPTKGFRIANLNGLLESYDSYSIYLNGRNCLFFYPIYTLGKDFMCSQRQVRSLSDVKNAVELFEDCVRAETNLNSATDNYVTFDVEFTGLMQNYKDSSNNSILKDQIVKWTIDSGPLQGQNQGYEKYSNRYKCFRFSNREVTEEMVTKNVNAKLNADPNATFDTTTMNRKKPLTAQQIDQLSLGEYVFVDVAQNRKAYDGNQFAYLQEENGDLLDINYKAGLFNIYIFVKQAFGDGKIRATENLANSEYSMDRFAFSEAEIAGINDIIKTKNIYVDKAVSCKMYDGFIEPSAGWSRHDGRDFYVVFEEKVKPINISTYGETLENSEINFSYAMHAGDFTDNSFVTNGGINFNVDDVTGTISTQNAITIAGNPVTLTYPNYYFTNGIDHEIYEVCNQNIGRGPNSVYATPKFSYIFSNGTRITKEYQSTQLLEKMYTAVTENETEKGRISVTLGENQTYTLAELETAVGMGEVYSSVMMQLQDVQLIKVKQSGNYRICIYAYKDDENHNCFDVWASMPEGFVVTIYDKRDFSNADISKDINGLLISRNWMTEYYTFIGNVSYHANSDLLYGKDVDEGIVTTFKVNESKVITPELQPYVFTSETSNYITLLDLLEYYDNQDKCLCDVSTGRCITYENIQTLPYVINKDCLFEVIDKPTNIA